MESYKVIAKKAVELFDYIHSVDNQKLADVLSKSQNAINKSIKYFIQVNIGNEAQKSGIPYNEVDQFYTYCTREKMDILDLWQFPQMTIMLKTILKVYQN